VLSVSQSLLHQICFYLQKVMDKDKATGSNQSGPSIEQTGNDQDQLLEFMREQDKQPEDEAAAEQQKKEALTERD
jgi:hypothetical protein